MGIVNVYQSVMIADTIDYEEYEHGIRPDGVFFAGQSFCTKLNSGIAALIQGIVYSVVGFSGEGVEKVNALLEAGASFKADPAFEPYRMAMLFLCSIPPSACCSPCCRCSIMTCRIKNMQRCSKSCVSAARRRRTRKQSEK